MATSSLVVCMLVLAAMGAQAQRQPGTLIIMGDSFSDNGNAWRESNMTMPSPDQGYVDGRFTDGGVWGDYIENMTGINVINTGYPGATACPFPPTAPNGGMPFFVPYLAQQANIVASQATGLPANRAALIWMGANDLSGLAQGLLGGQLNFTSALAMVPMINACIRETAEGLLRYNVVRHLTVSTIQNIAIQPIWATALRVFGVPPEQGQQALAGIGALVRALNEGIREDVSELAARYRRAKVATFDMYGKYSSTMTDGPVIGLTNTTHACLEVEEWSAPSGAPDNTVTSTCETPSSYMFWDYSHPSTATHAMLAEVIGEHLMAMSPELFPESK